MEQYGQLLSSKFIYFVYLSFEERSSHTYCLNDKIQNTVRNTLTVGGKRKMKILLQYSS